jgi:ribosomal protein L16 Arg81 hydroxylase
MNFDISRFEPKFLSIIHEFLEQTISVESFCSKFTDLWMKFRDDHQQIKKTWNEPLDQLLIEARLRGELSPEEFQKQFRELWKLNEIEDLSEMIDPIHSACSAFNPYPDNEWEINEETLRAEVHSYLTKYKPRPF